MPSRLQKQTKVLASNAPDETRLSALKYVIHFVGDVHQPLHAGYLDDKGGNTYQLQAFMRGSNLHALWDSGIIKNMNATPEVLSVRLPKNSVTMTGDFNPARAAEESCRIVGQKDFYSSRKIGMDYIEQYKPVLEHRLLVSGKRLPAVLNGVLK